MFGLFNKNNERMVRPYHPEKDLEQIGYKMGIELLAKTSDVEWLASNKMNSCVLLSSMDLNQKREENDKVKPVERLRGMILKMTDEEYAEWVKTVVFH